ncbi:MAG: hypothetical protein ABJG88_05365 [Litorimonas sp.]
MKSIQTLMVFLALSACSKISEGDAWSLEESEIISVSQTLPPCGILYSLVEMKLRDKRNQNNIIYLPCVEVIGGPLPKIGRSCTAKGKMEFVNGLIAEGSISHTKLVRLTRELTCDGKSYVFDL